MSDNWSIERTNYWNDMAGRIPDMRYVVETNEKVINHLGDEVMKVFRVD